MNFGHATIEGKFQEQEEVHTANQLLVGFAFDHSLPTVRVGIVPGVLQRYTEVYVCRYQNVVVIDVRHTTAGFQYLRRSDDQVTGRVFVKPYGNNGAGKCELFEGVEAHVSQLVCAVGAIGSNPAQENVFAEVVDGVGSVGGVLKPFSMTYFPGPCYLVGFRRICCA